MNPLLDSGAVINVMSNESVAAAGLPTHPIPVHHQFSVRGISGPTSAVSTYTIVPFKCNLPTSPSSMTFNLPFFITQLTSEKMIIGLPGLAEVNPKIDWKSGEVSLPQHTTAAVASLKTANESEEEERVSIKIKVEEKFAEEIKKLDSKREKLEEERREILEKRERLRNLDYDQKSIDDLVWEIDNLDRRGIRREREKGEKEEEGEREREENEREEREPKFEYIDSNELRRIFKRNKNTKTIVVNMCKLEEILQVGALEEREGNADQKRRQKLEEELRKKYADVFSDTLPPGGAPRRESV